MFRRFKKARMKKLITLTLALTTAISLNAQEAADKNIQAGLVIGYGMNFQKMSTKLMDADGVGSDLTLGMNANFGLTETIGLCSGIEFDFETIKYQVPGSDTVVYYYKSTDNTLVQYQDVDTTNSLYWMTSRKQKPMYITIPVMLIFRTKFIGYFRYFGKFGLRTSILLNSKFTDEGINLDPATFAALNTESNTEMRAKGEMFPVKSAVGLAGGAEWNFTGGTSLIGEIGYYYGFTPLHTDRKADKSYLYSSASPENPPVFSNLATQSQLMLKFSILF